MEGYGIKLYFILPLEGYSQALPFEVHLKLLVMIEDKSAPIYGFYFFLHTNNHPKLLV